MNDDSLSDDDPFREIEDLLAGGLEGDPERLIEKLKSVSRQIDLATTRSLAHLIEKIDKQLDTFEGRTTTGDEALQHQNLSSCKKKFQELLFPSERHVAGFHCPQNLIRNVGAIQDLLDRTEEVFDQVDALSWASRDSGFVCRANPHVYCANFVLRCKTICWHRALPQSLEFLLSSRNCERVRGAELDFVEARFAWDEEILDLVRSIRDLTAQQEDAVIAQRFDEASRIRDARIRLSARLNDTCIQREALEN